MTIQSMAICGFAEAAPINETTLMLLLLFRCHVNVALCHLRKKHCSMTEKEMQRLLRRHNDIAKHGVGVLELQAAKDRNRHRKEDFVSQHNLACFKCGTRLNEWAEVGVNQWAKPWAICQPCVRKRKTA